MMAVQVTDPSITTGDSSLNLEQFMTTATMDVFASMVFIDITPEAGAEADAPPIQSDLSSVIGLAGDLKGILSVQCPAEVAMGVTGAMLGLEITELGEDAKDAIGEIANMIAGGLKESLAAADKKIELAIPTTAIGKSIRMVGLSGAPKALVTFASALGRFGVELRYILA